ncbi:MAG: hypothetical protein IIB61_05745 [Planctomycetes bacterium]|nr:hypothetical protein [Planctomycetota bacterium]
MPVNETNIPTATDPAIDGGRPASRPSKLACQRGFEEVRAAGTTWAVCDDWRKTLLGETAPDWFSLDGNPAACLIKRGRHRAVWRVSLGRHTVYAKVFTAVSIFERLRWRLGGGPATREWRLLCAARKRGVAAVSPLAVATRWGDVPGNVLLTEGISDTETLGCSWDRHVSSATDSRRAAAVSLIECVARLLAAAHDSGFAHPDLHPSNLLVRRGDDGAAEAWFVDVHGARFRRSKRGDGHAIRALAQLDQHFHRRASKTQRMRFLCEYLAARCDGSHPRAAALQQERDGSHPRAGVLQQAGVPKQEGVAQPPSAGWTCRQPSPLCQTEASADLKRHWPQARALAAKVLAARRTHAAKLTRRRDRRLATNGKYFSAIALGNGWSGRVALTLERRHLYPERDVPDRTTAVWRGLLAPLLGATTPSQIGGLGEIDGISFRAVAPKGWVERLLWSIGGSPSRHLFEEWHRLRHRDGTAELALGWLEHRRAGIIDCSVLVVPRVGSDDGDDLARPTGLPAARADRDRAAPDDPTGGSATAHP